MSSAAGSPSPTTPPAGPSGPTPRPPAAGWAARDAYRTRFGVETPYRQKSPARGVTTSPGPGYRLLREGLAHPIRRAWVLRTEPLAGHRYPGWGWQLPLAALIEWLGDALRDVPPE
ncbi:hypothetical protein J0H58_36090, partial [bacterium]|nr:hypothetical protein [bacterium]